MEIDINGIGGLIQFAIVVYIALLLSGCNVTTRKKVYYDPYGTDVLGDYERYPRNHGGR